jgi:hypothetical protein
MIRLLTSEIQRVIVFGKKRVGKVHRRYVDVMRIYLGQPIKEVKPLFEARISREVVKLALERFKADFEDNGAFLMLSGEDVDEKVRRLVVFGGARQTVDESLGRPLLEIVASMNEVEVLFWYSRFIDAYERGGYWDVYRIAKSLRTLYRI